MDVTIEIEVGGKTFADASAAFDALYLDFEENLNSTTRPLTKELRKALQLVARKMEQTHSAPWNGGVVNNTDKLQRRSGGIREIAKSIKVSGGKPLDVMGTIGTAGFAIHETGGTIKAKRSKYLTIPLPSAMDKRGVPLRKRARDWDRTFVARSKRGNLIVFRKEARGVTPLYLLKPTVTIRPRLGMEKAIINDALPYFERKAFEIISEALG